MTKVITTRTNTFKFTSEVYGSNSYYMSTVIVKELEYESGQHYWDISYKNDFISDPTDNVEKINQDKLKLHPFYGSHMSDYMDYTGEILFKNPLTTIMVDYLLMDYEQIELESGLTTSQRYKQNIMWSLCYFWD